MGEEARRGPSLGAVIAHENEVPIEKAAGGHLEYFNRTQINCNKQHLPSTWYTEFASDAAVEKRQRACELALDALDGRKTPNEAVEETIKLKLKLMSGKYNAPHFLRLAFAHYGRLWPDNDFYIMNSSNNEYYQQLREEHSRFL